MGAGVHERPVRSGSGIRKFHAETVPFEKSPPWVPSLDRCASLVRRLLTRQHFGWFERTVFQAAKVRNVSRLGSL
jgi:hypothetical protein